MNDDSPDAREVAISGFYSGVVFGMMVPGGFWTVVGWSIGGGLIGAVLSWVPSFLVEYLLEAIYPEMPICKQGKCKPNDYEQVWTSQKHVGYIEHRLSHYMCRCKDQYKLRDNTFFELKPDSSEEPYMVRLGTRWVPVTKEFLETPLKATDRPEWWSDATLDLTGWLTPCAAFGAMLGKNIWNNLQAGLGIGISIGLAIYILLFAIPQALTAKPRE